MQIGGPKVGTPDNPIRHRIQPGETAYAIARLYNISVTSLAKWNGLDTDLSLKAGRELIIPVSSEFNRRASTQKNTVSAIPDTNISEKDEKKVEQYLDAGYALLIHKSYGSHLPKANLKSNIYILNKL